MGQKVNPKGFRLPVTKAWLSRNYAGKKDIPEIVYLDDKIRKFLKKKFRYAAVAEIVIERAGISGRGRGRVRVTLRTGKPGMVIGRKGEGLDQLNKELHKIDPTRDYLVDVKEVKDAETNPQLVAENIAAQLERRMSFRRAMKKAGQTAMASKTSSRKSIKGIRIECGGRLGGAEIARSEKYADGSIPRHTLREDVQYGFAEAKTIYGIIGIKCWICIEE